MKTSRIVLALLAGAFLSIGWAADEPQGNVASGATDAGNPLKVGGKYNGSLPNFTSGHRGDLQLEPDGSLRTLLVGGGSTGSDAQSNTMAWAYQSSSRTKGLLPVGEYVFNGTTWDRKTKATTNSRIVSAAADTNATSAKASAGTLHAISGYNAAATVRYLKIYNKASAPTVGTDTPILTLALKPTDRFEFSWPHGFYLATGIAYAMTTGAADADTGALTAADVVGLNISYN